MRRRGSEFPEWLKWSGLPAFLNEKIRIGAWSVFREIVELDCRRNRTPDAVEIAPAELAERCGVSAATCRRLLDGLRKKRALLVFLPESDEEAGLFQVRIPLKTPIPFEEVARSHPALHLMEPGCNDRYAREVEEVDPEDPKIRAVVDLYFDVLSMRMNSFILDELIFIAQRFPRREIERVFRRAAQLDRASLAWAARELSRRHASKEQKAKAR